jgi:hypothetical protein
MDYDKLSDSDEESLTEQENFKMQEIIDLVDLDTDEILDEEEL